MIPAPPTYVDVETYCELNLREVGVTAYVQHPSFELLLLATASGDGPVVVRESVPRGCADTARLLAAGKLVAHNAPFDRAALAAWGLPTPVEHWYDTAALCRRAGLPSDLDSAARLLLPAQQQKHRGDALLRRFCAPAPSNHRCARYDRRTHPQDWARFRAYCAQDVAACRAIHAMLSPLFDGDAEERAVEALDARINQRGVPVDVGFADRAVALHDAIRCDLEQQFRDLTGCGPRQVAAVREWLRAEGVVLDSLAEDQVAAALARPGGLPPRAARALLLRQQAALAAPAKYAAVLAGSTQGGGGPVMRDTLMYYGAERTGRWAGRRLQPQNMARPQQDVVLGADCVVGGVADLCYPDTARLLRDCVRGVIAAHPGHRLVVSDFANIEGRVLAWIAGETWKLEAFRAYDAGVGPDLYKLSYARAFGVAVERVGKAERQIGKVMELALGYQGGVGAFQTMASGYGVTVTDARADELKQAWRAAHRGIVQLWSAVEQAALAALRDPPRAYTAQLPGGQPLVFAQRRDWLLLRLPSGRCTAYYRPRIHAVTGRLTYYGARYAQHIDTYGGKLVENAVQATARDLLRHALLAADAAGWNVVLHVHDEIVCHERSDDAARNAAALSAVLARAPAWAAGLPLAAEGYESHRYNKP